MFVIWGMNARQELFLSRNFVKIAILKTIFPKILIEMGYIFYIQPYVIRPNLHILVNFLVLEEMKFFQDYSKILDFLQIEQKPLKK